jgi:hypothetical protein
MSNGNKLPHAVSNITDIDQIRFPDGGILLRAPQADTTFTETLYF